jgi:hypothetical protein
MHSNLLIEALAVGAMTALALCIARLVTPISTIREALIVGFVIGVVFHLGCQVSGINAWYCKHGAACSSS